MRSSKSEQGQALVLIVFAIIGLVAMTGLAVDTGLAYTNRQQAQNTADAAAFSAALAKVRGASVNAAALNIIQANGFENSQVTINNPPGIGCNGQNNTYAGDNNYIQIMINSQVDTYFAGIVGVNQLNNCVETTTFVESSTLVSLFNGNAIVGLNPRMAPQGSFPCGFDSGNSNAVRWILRGGGIFSNGCAHSKNGSSVNLDEDASSNPTQCVTTVGPSYNFKCSQPNQGASAAYTADDIKKLMPPNPTCNDTLEGGYNVSAGSEKPGGFYFENGLYCVSDFEIFHKKDVTLNNAVLYITDSSFDLKFAGKGGFGGSAPTSGPYAGYYMVIAPNNNNPCERYQERNAQSLEFRGHGTADIVGTILAPTACIDFRGNSNGRTTRSQLIGYTISSNGNADLYINYNADENAKAPSPASIQLIE